ncbi:MAG: NADP oxidoreductase [Deltaproteobacteria bacterium HGW-Deltaproteobacteria-19]|jgi:NADP-reducing hydrogenase subunit HndB|nr:MAG: NADP oxidoreductase [Deltaproteobacteria bacterium HGW-Deltaproteobacteria-19]
MAKLKIEDLKKIKERVHAETALRDGERRAKITVHMGTCGIASGARDVMDALMKVIEEAGVIDVAITTSGCMGLCSREPLVTVELIGQEPIKYEYMDANKMRQVFKKHVLEGEIQTPFVLARGAEIVK